MVERTEAQTFDEFVGFARKVEVVEGNYGKQWHIEIEPEDKTLFKNSKTNRFHEWIRITPKSTESSVPDGSVLDLYLKEMESLFKEAKKTETVKTVLEMLLDRKILYRKKQLGRKFEGKEAADHWIPARLA